MSETQDKQKPKEDISADEKFIDSLITQGKTQKTIAGIELRAPTLATLAILTRCENALCTGEILNESEVMIHVLVFMYVHSAPIDEVHGASIIQPIAGKNIALERKGLELGEKLPFRSPKDFVTLYEELTAWLGEHMDLRVEPIPDDSTKGKAPNPNE